MESIIVFAPLVGSIICGFGWKIIGEKAALWTATGLLFYACFVSWASFLGFNGVTEQVDLFRWIESGSLSTSWGIRLDRLTEIMLIVVTTVSSLVHLYSFGYMDHDPQWREGEVYKPRFFAYLSFFTFAMLMLVTSNNLVQMFFGWEGVGVASYLLIGFYWRKQSAGAAAMKAFIVNRVGDFGFALGIFALFFLVDSISFDVIFASAPELAQTQISFLWTDWNAAELVSLLLFIGAMGKSAQLLLHTWLPDAMEGPTPVSALIHAATMVTAGVFLVCRMSPLMEYAPQTLTFITFMGAATAFFAATVGLVQNDIKRVIAYSTCSQLGYMFVAAGVGVYSAAMFHLLTHAFFKALLFLGAGSVIHAMHHEQDMRHYGGLRKKIPFTFWMMMIGTLAITGVGIPLTSIGFAGFLSKDAIIESAWAGQNSMATFAFVTLVLAACMTSFYSWRLIFMTFYGAPRPDHHHSLHTYEHAHESPRVMLIPLAVLATGAVLSGMIFYKPFFGDHAAMTTFFGMPHHEAAATEGHSAAPAEGHATEAAAPAETHTAPAAETHTAPAAETHAAPAADTHAAAETAETHAAAPAEAHAAAPGAPLEIGAIYMAEDNTVIDDAHHAPIWVKVSPFVAMLIGFCLAWLMYVRRPDYPARLARANWPLYQFLLNKWYFDEIYDAVFVRPAQAIGRFLWKWGDGATIDGGINGLAMGVIPFFTRLAGRMQSGYLFHYAFAMVLGIAALITLMTLAGGAH